MPLDPKEFEKVFANHFEKISPEQFLDNLKEACPYLFDEDSIVTTNSIEAIEYNPMIEMNLSKQAVENYILSHGWQQVDHPNKNLQVFAGLADNDGRSIRLVLPVSNDLKDTPLRIYQAIQTIADVEDRSLNAVVTDIEKVRASK
jgi:hypothetical protein